MSISDGHSELSNNLDEYLFINSLYANVTSFEKKGHEVWDMHRDWSCLQTSHLRLGTGCSEIWDFANASKSLFRPAAFIKPTSFT